jgi:hypothetical protein
MKVNDIVALARSRGVSEEILALAPEDRFPGWPLVAGGSNAIIGTGVLLRAGDGAVPEVFVTVAEIVSLKPPQLSRNEVDVSNHNEGPVSGEAKILGMLRKGQCTATLNWLPTDPTHAETGQGLLADLIANKKRNWRITYPPLGLPKWTFPGRVQLFDPSEITVDAPMQLQVGITIDGQITIATS